MTQKHIGAFLISIIGVIIVLWASLWVWILASSDPLNNLVADWPLFPVACTTRGCITSSSWLYQHQLIVSFSTASLLDTPTAEQSFTTKIRQHLLKHATVQSPATLADAGRYREEILHISSQDQLSGVVSLMLSDYDEQVLLPFLQQEGLRDLYKVESVEELYGVLSEQRRVVVLPFQYTWDAKRGEVVRKN